MKKLFTNDPEEIAKEINSLIEHKAELICGKGGTTEIQKVPLVAKSKTTTDDLFITLHPDPPCDSTKCPFYYNAKGAPLRYFEAERVKKAEQLLGLKYPKEIYSVYRRKHPRVKAARQSIVTFSILNRQRIYTGNIFDISLNGAQLLVDIPAQLSKADTLCALSFTLCSRLLADYEEIITLPTARIVWLKSAEERIHAMGIHFKADEKALDDLSRYVYLRSIEDPKDLAN